MLFSVMAMSAQSQEFKQIPLVTVNGEGKVKVTPDQVQISVGILSKGIKAVDVKKENDFKIDAVIKYIKKMNIAKEDYQTERVYLNDQYDYDKKKHNYVATQTLTILLKNISKYDELMEGLVETGINNINDVEFKSSKLEFHKSEARKLAVLNAKTKAVDLTNALGQTIGAAFSINDNSAVYYPPQRYQGMALKMADEAFGGNETLAVGEIEITAQVAVSFYLK